MRWREEKKSDILDMLFTSARVRRTQPESFEFKPHREDLRGGSFHLDCDTFVVDRDSFSIDSFVISVNTSFECEPKISTLLGADVGSWHTVAAERSVSFSSKLSIIAFAFSDVVCTNTLGDWDQLVVHTADLVIPESDLHKIPFVKRRREPETSLFGRTEERRSQQGRLPRQPKPKPPPEHDSMDLAERLRWLLTPPIQELLSDSQFILPAAPFPFQLIGIKWLMDRKNALLCDEMGLGKTMQAIIAARLLWRDHQLNRILVVCPKPLISTWLEEIEKWWPATRHNTCVVERDRQFFLSLAMDSHAIKIINYESVAAELEWIQNSRCTHDLIIIDEAQRIKNPETKAARAVKALKSDRRWALTGTPLENKIEDVISIFGFVKPGLMSKNTHFDHVRPLMAPYFLRRRTDDDDVELDLPDKDDQDIPITLGRIQRDAYNHLERDRIAALNEQGDTVTVQHVFALIQKLIQLCNVDPVSLKSAKLDFLNADLEEIIDNERKTLIFSNLVKEPFGLKGIKERLPDRCGIVEMHGQIPQARRDAVRNDFNKKPEVNVMLLHYRVGGAGLNLQAANYVYLFDRWWNPAVEDQAVARAHRIGQANKVIVRRLFCKDTIEERILQKLAEKRRLFAHVIDDDRPDPAAMGMSEEEVFSLFKNLQVRPKRTRPVRKPKIILDNLDPLQFEEFVAQVYEAQGYSTTLTSVSHDGGIDILVERQGELGKERIPVQCKHQKAKVGRPELQKLWGVLHGDQSFTRADFVTSSGFTRAATDYASAKRLTLIDRDDLLRLASDLSVATIVDPRPED